MKTIGIIILAVIGILIIAACVYAYKCMNYWQKDYKKTVNAG
ncbi:MAG: hypothetical protein K0R09_2998, partial [Clostridiales bacterium]|nr:hypothetical protein [Clostridiales bacterium]